MTAAKIELRRRSIDVSASSVASSSSAVAAAVDDDKLNVNRISCPELNEIYDLHQKQYVEMMMKREKLLSLSGSTRGAGWKDVLAECKIYLFITLLNKPKQTRKAVCAKMKPDLSFCPAVATRIVEEVNLEYHENKSIDIRKFVKIKKLPGGDIADSFIVDGEVFSGRVMRVGMKQDRTKPRLLLIRDNLSFPRSDKLVSMENLGAQQEE